MTQLLDEIDAERPLRIGVLGAGGQLGTCLVREIEASSRAELAFATTRDELDLVYLDELEKWLDERLRQCGGRPLDVVVNAAAYTKVDACESEPELACQINALAPAAMARTLIDHDTRFIHVSTDYVFAGDGDRPYCEDDPTDPRTVYGKSKRAGEIAVLGTHPHALVIRTSWLFGPGRNFVAAILDQAAKCRSGEVGGPLRVVDDQLGSPTSAMDLAVALLAICLGPAQILRGAAGLLHLRNAGETTWFGFATKILEEAGYQDVAIVPVPTAAFETAAPRPAYSILDDSLARRMGIEFRPWYEALASYLASGSRSSAFSAGQSRDDSIGQSSGSARDGSIQEVPR